MRRRMLMMIVVAAAASAAPAGAAPTTSYGGEFPFNRDGERAWAAWGAIAPTRSGDVWATAGLVKDQVFLEPLRRFSSSGTLLQTIPDTAPDPNDIRSISDIALSPDDAVLYVAARITGRYDLRRPTTQLGVLRISAATGNVLGSFAAPGDSPGSMRVASRVEVAPDGDVLVQPVTGPIKRYDAAGNYLAEYPLAETTVRSTSRLAIDPRNGDLYFPDGLPNDTVAAREFDVYSPNGEYRGSFGGDEGTRMGSAIAVRPQDGARYVPAGQYVMTLGTDGKFAAFTEAPGARGLDQLALNHDGSRLWTLNDEFSNDPATPWSIRWFDTGVGPDPVPGPGTPPARPPAGPGVLAPVVPPSGQPGPSTSAPTTVGRLRLVGATGVVRSSRTGSVALRVAGGTPGAKVRATVRTARKVRTADRRLRRITLGSATRTLGPGGTGSLAFRLSAANRLLLRRLKTVRVEVRLTSGTSRSFLVTLGRPRG